MRRNLQAVAVLSARYDERTQRFAAQQREQQRAAAATKRLPAKRRKAAHERL